MMVKCPLNLKGEARKFFVRHVDRCTQDGSLTDATLDAFILLCRTWELLQTLDFVNDAKTVIMKWNGLCKRFADQGLQFGMTSKKKVERIESLEDIISNAKEDA